MILAKEFRDLVDTASIKSKDTIVKNINRGVSNLLAPLSWFIKLLLCNENEEMILQEMKIICYAE
jgi:hypothetical protein